MNEIDDNENKEEDVPAQSEEGLRMPSIDFWTVFGQYLESLSLAINANLNPSNPNFAIPEGRVTLSESSDFYFSGFNDLVFLNWLQLKDASSDMSETLDKLILDEVSFMCVSSREFQRANPGLPLGTFLKKYEAERRFDYTMPPFTVNPIGEYGAQIYYRLSEFKYSPNPYVRMVRIDQSTDELKLFEEVVSDAFELNPDEARKCMAFTRNNKASTNGRHHDNDIAFVAYYSGPETNGEELLAGACMISFAEVRNANGEMVLLPGNCWDGVKKCFWGRGIGQEMAKSRMEFLKRLGCETMVVQTEPGSRSQFLYSKLGFHYLGSTLVYSVNITNPGAEKSCIRFER